MRKFVAVAVLFLVVGAVVGRLSVPREAGAVDCVGATAGKHAEDQFCLDTDGDGLVNITDGIYVLNVLFLGEALPDCGCYQHQDKDTLAVLHRRGPLPATGQTACWDKNGDSIACGTTETPHPDYPGTDGEVQAGCPREGRFVVDDKGTPDVNDDTVLDNCTGLEWTRTAVDVNKDGERDSEDTVDWQGALKACAALNGVATAGTGRWRLPNVAELQSIVDYGSERAIDAAFLDPVEGTTAWFWTSTTMLYSSKVYAPVVLFGGFFDGSGQDSGTSWSSKDSGGYSVRAVRSVTAFQRATALPATGQTECYTAGGGVDDCANPGVPGQDGAYRAGCSSVGRFVDNGDGTISDLCTGLMWTKDPVDINGDSTINSADNATWTGALNACENSTFAGHDDWRLPNIRELTSILDYGRNDPATDPVFPPPGSSTVFWSSTSMDKNPADGWIVYFSDGQVEIVAGAILKGYLASVRAVRTIQPGG